MLLALLAVTSCSQCYCIVSDADETAGVCQAPDQEISVDQFTADIYGTQAELCIKLYTSITNPVQLTSQNSVVSVENANPDTQIKMQISFAEANLWTFHAKNVELISSETDVRIWEITLVQSSLTTNADGGVHLMCETISADLNALKSFASIRPSTAIINDIQVSDLPADFTLHLLPVSGDQKVTLNILDDETELLFGAKSIEISHLARTLRIQVDEQASLTLGMNGGNHTLRCSDGLYNQEFMKTHITCAYFYGDKVTFMMEGSNWPIVDKCISVGNIPHYQDISFKIRGKNIPLELEFHDWFYYHLILEEPDCSIQGSIILAADACIETMLSERVTFGFMSLLRPYATGMLQWPENVHLEIEKYTDARWFSRPITDVTFHQVSGENEALGKQIVLAPEFHVATTIASTGDRSVVRPVTVTGGFYTTSGSKTIDVGVAVEDGCDLWGYSMWMDSHLPVYCSKFDFECNDISVSFHDADSSGKNLGTSSLNISKDCMRRALDGYKCVSVKLESIPPSAKQTICVSDSPDVHCYDRMYAAINTCDLPILRSILDTRVSTYVLDIFSNIEAAFDLSVFNANSDVILRTQETGIHINIACSTVSHLRSLVIENCYLSFTGESLAANDLYLSNCLLYGPEYVSISASKITCDFSYFYSFASISAKEVDVFLDEGESVITWYSTTKISINAIEITGESFVIRPGYSTTIRFSPPESNNNIPLSVNCDGVDIFGVYTMNNRGERHTAIYFDGEWQSVEISSAISVAWSIGSVVLDSMPIPVELYPGGGSLQCLDPGMYTVTGAVNLDSDFHYKHDNGGELAWETVAIRESLRITLEYASFKATNLAISPNVVFNSDQTYSKNVKIGTGAVVSPIFYTEDSTVDIDFSFLHPPSVTIEYGCVPTIRVHHVLDTDDTDLLLYVRKDYKLICGSHTGFNCPSVLEKASFNSSYFDSGMVTLSCTDADFSGKMCLKLTLTDIVELNPGSQDSPAEDPTNVGLIVGLVVGIVALIVIAVVVFFIIKKKKANQEQNDPNGPVPMQRSTDAVMVFKMPPIPLRLKDIERIKEAERARQAALTARDEPPSVPVKNEKLLQAAASKKDLGQPEQTNNIPNQELNRADLTFDPSDNSEEYYSYSYYDDN